MNTKTEKILKQILQYALMSIVTVLIYVVTLFLLDIVFGWFGGEEEVSRISAVAVCIVCTAAVIIADKIVSRKGDEGRSRKIIRICRQIMWTTTFMFCGTLLIEWLIQSFSDKTFALGTLHWLSFSFAVAIFSQIEDGFKKKTDNANVNELVVAAGCNDLQEAEAVSNMLESNDIKTMIVGKDSPMFIKNGDKPVQIQICRKDMGKAAELL